ncbi:vWA domain-containing protein [Longimicrobium sp.]|uniref:vWA domain-containing protein n=1 Tax=Longimicrobium sp. TaxID=2029185 RepID=UPI002E35275F|nr:von Willebrand factor type A domain-containing protein [Longimicrobium sp.]HEX6037519.1 von Willebrand factor type A domain-containing protein [Longimicrobium sp.]
MNRSFVRAVLALLLLLAGPLAAQERPAVVAGRVTNTQGQPEAAVLVRIEALNVAAYTAADGRYRLVIPAERIRPGQPVTIRALRTGLSPDSRTVTLSPGAHLTQDFQMATSVLLLEDVVVTGVPAPTSRARVPYAVGSVSAAEVQASAPGSATAMQGKVPGVTVAQGTAPSVLLRGTTTVHAPGGPEPLYVVDGAIVSADALRQLDPARIASIEVVKGAAAASLYGSRAANGVIQVTTVNGEGLPADSSQVALAPADTAAFSTEEYNPIYENPFLAASREPLSTFGIDVDPASYSNVRRFVRDGTAPPRDAVRIEELVNYFAYDYPDPTGPHPFAVVTEVGAAPWNPRHQLVHVGIQGRRMETRDLPPSNLVFLVDVSGSMDEPDKLPLVKQSLRMLVEELDGRDRVALVVYAGAAGLVLDATPGDRRETILDAIDRLDAGGSTAGAEGIRLAYEVARRGFIPGGNNRVILATDGDFNVGVSSESELVQLIEQKRQEGTFLTVLGFGRGNLADARMEQMANHGNGNYAYIDGLMEARKVLVQEMGGTLFTIAKDVKLQVEFNPARVYAYRLIGYENRLLAAEDFADDRKDAGELGAGHSVTALYEIVPVGEESTVDVGDVADLRYQRPSSEPVGAFGGELMNVNIRYKQPQGDTSVLLSHAVRVPRGRARLSDDFRFAAAVAEFGMLLRGSEHRGRSSLDEVMTLARGSLGDDPRGYRRSFLQLVQDYRRLPGGDGDVAAR